jgi:crotonobetainyl-CoA:carnitine CoA-transferase CaiB-like acyl-CoA transferase
MVCHEVGDYYDADVRYLRNREDRWEHSPKLACKDGYIMMNIPDQFWAPLMDMLGNPEWSKEEKYQTAVGRHFNLRDSQPHVIEWMKHHSVYEVEKLAKEKRLPFSIVRTMKEVAADKLFVERNYYVDVDHKIAGKIRFPGAPCKFSATPGKIRHAAPLLGEHNSEVFEKILGYSPEKLVKMQQAGAI